MKKVTLIAISIAIFSACKKSDNTTTPAAQTNVSGNLTNLWSFTGLEGGVPYGDVTFYGGVLYGMTQYGGANTNQYGTIFSINPNGTGILDLHNFVNTDGAYPQGDLLISNGVMYGMTLNGGSNNDGVIFSVNTNGTGYTVIHNFTGSGNDGNQPTGSLILEGNTLFGMTTAGGIAQGGNIFSINVNGSNYRDLVDFTGAGNGGNPNGTLTFSAHGDTLFGMARVGGSNGGGLVFAVDTNGSGFRDLYNFGGVTGNGANPEGNLTLSGTTLYGMTTAGGASNHGCIFSLSTSGSNYTDLFDFNGTTTGNTPNGSLLLSGSTLYGMTSVGGIQNQGILFSVGTNGSGFYVMYTFGGAFGANPDGSVIMANNELYGMTSMGGASTYGIIFSFQL